MAHTASRTTLGFEKIGNMAGQPDPGRYYELTPALAVGEGNMLVLTNAKVALAAAGATNVLGVAAEGVTAHATDVTEIRVYDNPFNIYRCTFSDQFDGTADSGTTTTIVDATLTQDTNDDWLGSLLYVYEGTNMGQVRTISAFTAASDRLTWIDPMPSACDTTTKFILLGEGDDAGTNAMNVGTIGVNLKDKDTIDIDAAVDAVDGPLAIVNILPKDLMADVIIIKHLYNSR